MELELNHLTESERDAIITVLRRDEDLRHKEQERIRTLRTDLRRTKLKGIIKAGNVPADKTCARCREAFGWITNKGAVCPKCQFKVCDKCRTKTKNQWTCVLCHKEKELEAQSGLWFYSQFRKSKRNTKTNKVISGPDIIRSSIRRSRRTAKAKGQTPSDEVRQAMTNNTAAAKMAAASPRNRRPENRRPPLKSPIADISDMGFPNESDKERLQMLIQHKAPSESTTTSNRTMTTKVYESDSSSSSSPENSPHLSNRTADSAFIADGSSPRSSLRSIASSEGHISVVTEMNVSDIEVQSLNSARGSPMVRAHNGHQRDHSGSPTRHSASSPTRHSASSPTRHSPHESVIMSVKPDDDQSQNEHEFEKTLTAAQVVDEVDSSSGVTRRSENGLSFNKEEAEEYDTEALTQYKFKRVSTKRGPADGDEDAKSRTSHASSHHDPEVNGSAGQVSSPTHSRQDSHASGGRSSFRNDVEAEATDHSDHRSDHSAVPAIVVTPEAKHDKPDRAPTPTADEEDIDDVFAAYGNTRPPPSVSRMSIHSNFSESRESLASYYSDAGEGHYGNILVTGEIQYGLDYNYKTGTLEVRIKQCKDLAPVDPKKKRSDPYVKVYLLPDKTKSGKRKTRVKKHTLNPTFDEILRYTITKSELESRTLWLSVWHSDMFGRNDFLGESTMNLDYYTFDKSGPKWYKLQERHNPSGDIFAAANPMSLLTYKGDLVISLKYVTADHLPKKKYNPKGELHVLVKEARNLTAVRANGSSDPLCVDTTA